MRQSLRQCTQYKAFASKSLSMMMAMLFLFVSACSPFDSPKRNVLDSSDGSQVRRAKLNTDVPLEDIKSLAKPANINVSANRDGVASGQKGLNLQPQTDLFRENIRDKDDRIDRLEYAVQDIRNEIDSLSPSIDRLVAIESDMKELFEQLRVLLGDGDRVEAVLAAPNKTQEPLPIIEATPRKSATVAPAQSTKKAAPSNLKAPLVRVADSASKTRIVFETDKTQSISADFDVENQVLLVDLDYALSEKMIKALTSRSKIISTADIIESGSSTSFALGVKNIASATKITHIAPNKDNKNHRYFLDLKK